MPSKPKRPTETQVRDAILADFEEEDRVVVASLQFGRAHIVGVCRLSLDVKEQTSKSVFQPTERVVTRTVGQTFLVIPCRPPRDDEEFIPSDQDWTWAEGVERESGAMVVIATSAADCRAKLRQKGLPL